MRDAPRSGAATPAEAYHHYTAAQSGVVDSARFLIAFTIVPSLQTATSRLHALAARGDANGLRTLLDAGEVLEIDEPSPSCGSPALLLAASIGSAATVRVLLEAGAAPEGTGRAGVTPLMAASAMGHEEVVVALIEGGASINHPHAFGGTTAIHFAAEMGRGNLIRTLCMNGADAEAIKTNGGRPLHTASDADQPGGSAGIDQPTMQRYG